MDYKSDVIYKKLICYAESDGDGSWLAYGISSRGNFGDISKQIAIMDRTRKNEAWRYLKSNRIFAPIIIFAKKCMRRCLKFYVEPIALQQTDFNNAATTSTILLTQKISEQQDVINDLRTKLEKLEKNMRKDESDEYRI